MLTELPHFIVLTYFLSDFSLGLGGVMAANILGDDLDPDQDFSWLDEISDDDCFMALRDNDSNTPSKSLDFGRDGYTGSLTAWHELLQITAPDPSCGLVYVRGDFPDDANSVLARTQHHNVQGSWGLKPEFNDQDDLRLTGPDNTGFINLRWPCSQFSLTCDGYENGTYTTCSFVKDNLIYQIIRIMPGKPLTERHGSNIFMQRLSKPLKLKFRIGGRVRMGCPRNSYHSNSPKDIEGETINYSERTKTLSFRSSQHNSSLAIRMWVDRQQVEFKPGGSNTEKNILDMTAVHEVALVENTPKVIVASFSFFNSASHESHKEIVMAECLPGLILSSAVQDYMGVADSSTNASYRLWRSVLPQEDIKRSNRSDFELNIVGRSVEQILCVSSIPIFRPNAKEEPKTQSRGEGQGPLNITHKGIALIKNIISSQWVDLESTFWQIRLLIKACNFLSLNLLTLPEKGEVYGEPLLQMGILYKEALLKHIESACMWLLNAPLTPNMILPSVVLRDPESEDWRYNLHDARHIAPNRAWYHTIILWYVLQHCPSALETPEMKMLLSSRMASLIDVGYELDDPKSPFIQWYHYSCFLRICKKLESEGRDPVLVNGPEYDRFVAQEMFWKFKAQKSLRPIGNGRWSKALEDHHVANLAFLEEELFLDSAEKTRLPNESVSYAKDFIQNRERTTILNPGRKDRKQATSKFQDTSPPWELLSLNHHSLLRPEVGASEEKVDAVLDECQEFIFSDYTFIGSWDRSDKCMVSTWWDLLPSSILASTLLDRRFKLQEDAETINAKEFTLNQASLFPRMEVKNTEDDTTNEAVKILLERLSSTFPKQADEGEEFDWRSRRPQKICFPDVFVESLEDTPEIFQLKQLKNINIRSNLRKYLETMSYPGWSLDTVEENIEAEELLYLSCWDISRSEGSGKEIYIRSVKGRADQDYKTIPVTYWYNGNTILYHLSREGPYDGILESRKTRTCQTLWSFYLNGFVEQHPKFGTLPQALRESLKDSAMRNDILSNYQTSLFSILNDSFVDLGTQYRIFFIQRYSPKVIQAFIYMWHTDALDAFNDHLGTASKFFDGIASNGLTDVWVTRFTISHWSFEYDDDPIPKVFEEIRGGKAEFPPPGVAHVHRGFLRNLFWFWSKPESPHQNSQFIVETASSLVITGDEKGFSWTCSVISSILEESVMKQCTEDAPEILEMFMHQQYTGRTLVFVMFLGHICEKVAQENEHFLHTLKMVMEMDEKALLQGIEWRKSQMALRRLKNMLWAMEALRIFNDKLLNTLIEIKEARSRLIQELNKENSLRHKALKRYMERVLEEFETRYTRLKDSHTSILQIIEPSARLREGITSVLGVEQNENIAMLTYITIAYLPLGFIAAIFSTHIVPDSTGLNTFGWLIAIFLIGTFIFARSLQTILGATRNFWKAVNKKTSAWEKSFAPTSSWPDTSGSGLSTAKISNPNGHSELHQKKDLESGIRPSTR